MRKTFLLVFLLILFYCPFASAVVFTVDADLNSVTQTYYQNIVPPYLSDGPLNTGLYLNAGDLLEISASGIWSNAPPSYNLIFGPDGNPNENIAPTYPGAGYPVASLLGKIGSNNYVFLGSNYSSYVNQSGVLYLGFNDTDYGNNWGTVNADVIISPVSAPVPEPTTLSLLGLGLAGLVFRKKKTTL